MSSLTIKVIPFTIDESKELLSPNEMEKRYMYVYHRNL